jgi:hypothetical protein
MKSGNFATLLNAFSHVLKTAGASAAANQIEALASIFTVLPTSNISGVVGRLKSLHCPHNHDIANLKNTIILLSSFKELLCVLGKAPVSHDIDETSTLASLYPSADIRNFRDVAVEALRTKPAKSTGASKGKSAKPLRNELISLYQDRLATHLDDPESFTADFNELRSNADMGRAELIALANVMTGVSPRTRDAALKRIWNRHQSLMTSKAKSRATSGRSAA